MSLGSTLFGPWTPTRECNNCTHHSHPPNTCPPPNPPPSPSPPPSQENHALYQRLVALRPSKDISRETLDKAHQADLKYRANCSTFKNQPAGAGGRAASPQRQQAAV